MTDRDSAGTAYELSGLEDGPPVVLIHGLGVTRRMWDQLVPALSACYRVLSYDLAGHGESARSAEVPSLSVFSAQLCGLLDHLGIARAAIVGFSLGGMINRRFALDHGGRAAALAILNSPHERGPEAQRLVEERAVRTEEGGPGATLDAAIDRWFTPEFRQARSDVIAQVRRTVLANDPEVFAQCRQVLAKGVVELIRPDPPIGLPTLVMTCEHDSGSTPDMSHGIAAEIEGAETVIVPRLQHMGLVEEPALFTDPLLRFLERVLGGGGE